MAGTIFVSAFLAVIVGSIITSIVRKKKKGISVCSCGGGCSKCGCCGEGKDR